jgi:hypothetical protein
MIDVAKKYISYGVNVIPLKQDKSPNVHSWGMYQKTMFSDFNSKFEKIGLICGKISGGIEVIDIDCKYDITGKLFENYKRFINFNDKNLLQKLVIQKTVSNGYHFIFRCKTIEGNKKLASRPANKEETTTGEKVKVLIETRGEGGYIAVYPSDGYELLQNDLKSIPDLTEREREVLMCSARALNEINIEVYEPPKKAIEWADNGLKPWEDFDKRGNGLDLLLSHGWTTVFERGDRVYLKRPGNSAAKTSGSYNTKMSMFKSWSTSTAFESEKGYTPAAIFSVLECGGDFKEAGRKLYELGYGDRSDLIKAKKAELEKKDDYDFISKEIDENGYLVDFYNGNLSTGLSTGFELLDKHFVWKEGNLIINNGHMNVGKSTILWYLMVLNNLIHGWKWIVFSSENREAAIRRRFMEFRYGKDYNKFNAIELKEGKKWAYDNFTIIKSENIENYETIIDKCERLMNLRPFKGLLIDPYNSLDVPMSGKSHEYHYKATTAFRIFSKNYNCSTVINTHAVTEALRKLDKDGYPVPPNSADTEGGGKFANRADDFLTFHRLTQDESSKSIMQIHVRKIKETETGGSPTPLNFPVKLNMRNVDGFFGFYDTQGNCPLKEIRRKEIESNGAQQKIEDPAEFERQSFYEKPAKELENDFLTQTNLNEVPF